MTAPYDLDRQLDAFLLDGPTALPDPSFDAIRDRTEVTRQRVVFGPWRVSYMNKLVPLGVGIAAVAVAFFIGGRLLASPAPADVGPSVQPLATPSASPTPPPGPTSPPSPSPAASPPHLTQTFTSQLHGFSASYPEGWIARAATEPWTERPGDVPQFSHPGYDVLYDPVLGDHLFLDITSQPIGDSTPDEWVAQQFSGDDCAPTEPIAVDGAAGQIGANDCDFVAVATAGRGYWIELLASNDFPVAVAPYDRGWFEEVLATVQLQPEDAVDVAPSTSP